MSVDPVNGGSVPASPPPPPGGGILPVIYNGSFEKYVPFGFLRLDFQVTGDAYLQLKDTVEQKDWPDPTVELFIPKGTHSIPLLSPAYGWRAHV